VTDLDIRADGEHRYRADVTDAHGATGEYVITVPERLLDELNLETADEPLLVRSALELLLARHGEVLDADFGLDDAVRTYPHLLDEIRAAVGR
jgi:hypothetical protein